MESDFKSMKRKELQALCKKHGLPANSTNLNMAENLASLLQKKEHKSEEMKPKGCLKCSGGSSGEDVGSAQGVSKKVSFSLEEDKTEFDELEKKSDGKYSPEKRSFGSRRSAIAFRPVKAMEEDEAVEVPARITRSRSLAVAVMWSPGVEKKKVRKCMEAVCQNDEPPQVVNLPSPNKRNRRKAEIELSHAVPTTRNLRNRVVVVVKGDEGSVSDSKPRRAQTKRAAKEENEASIAPLMHEATIAKEVENAEVFRGKSRPKHLRGAVSVEEICAFNASEMVPPCEVPLLRRSKRIRKVDNNLEQCEESKADAVDEMIRPKNTRNGSLRVSVAAVNKAEKQVAEETEMAPQIEGLKRSRHDVSKGNEESGLGTSLPACGKLKDECVAVAGKISNKKRRIAPNGKDLAPSVLDDDMLNDTVPEKVNRGRLCEHKEPPRRSTRSSSMHRILDHETNDVGIVRKNEPVKQERNIRTRRGTMESAAPRSEIETSLQAQGSQGESQRGSQPEKGLRHLRCNASEYSMLGHEISLPVGGNLIGAETNKRNRLQKQNKSVLEISLPVGGKAVNGGKNRGKNLKKRQRGQILGKSGPEASVPDCKTGVDAESLEDNESSKEPQMKFKNNAAKRDSSSDTVPVTLADEKQKCEKHAEIQTVVLQVMEAKFGGYTLMEDCSSSFRDATDHEDSNEGSQVVKITDEILSCNHPEVLSAAIVEGDSAVIYPNVKTHVMPVEIHNASNMASQLDSCLQVDASDNEEKTIQLSTVVAGSDLEDMLKQQKVCGNGLVNCGASEDTMLNAESATKGSDDVKQCSETVAKPSDPHISAILMGEDNSTNFSLFINPENVGFQSGENNFEENFKDEIRQYFPHNVCSDEVRISHVEFPKGNSKVMQSGSSSNVMDSDPVDRELSPSKLVEVTCGINEPVQEMKEKSKMSIAGCNEEQITILVDSIISEEQEEALEIGLDKELSCSKVMEVQSEISDLLSERPGHSNVEAAVQVESLRDSASQGNLNVDDNVTILLLDDACIYRKQDEVQDVLHITDLKSPSSTIVADNNGNPVDALHCENSDKRDEARGFGGNILPFVCPEDLSNVIATKSSSWIDDDEHEPSKQENVNDVTEGVSHIDGPSPVHLICCLDSSRKDLLSLQMDSRIKMRSGGVARNAMLNSQSDSGGCDVVSIRKKYHLDGNSPLFKDCCQDTGTREHLPDNQKDSKNKDETCGAVSSDIYSHKSAPGEHEVLDKFKEELMEDNQSQLFNSFVCQVLPEQSNLELDKVELQETNETDACGYASDVKGSASDESLFPQTILEKSNFVDAGVNTDLSDNQKITLHVQQVSTDSLTKIINVDPESGVGLRDNHAVQKARLQILDGIVGNEGELKGSVGNKESNAPSDNFDGEVVYKPESAACKEMILSPERLGSVEALRSEQGSLSSKQNVQGIDEKEASKVLVREFDWRDFKANEAFEDRDVEEKLDAKLNSINWNEVHDIVSAESGHNNGTRGTIISITSNPEYSLEKSEHGLYKSGKLSIMKRAHEVLGALKSEVDEASFIMRLLIGSKGLITQDDKEISPNDAVDQVGFTKNVCKFGALDEAKPYCINSCESLCSNSKNDKAVLTSQFDLKDHDDGNGSQYLKNSGLELDCGLSEEADISGNKDQTGTPASHLSCKLCKQEKEKVKETSSEGKFSSSNKFPCFCISSESKSKDVWDAPGAKLISLEDLFQMESDASYPINDNAGAGFCWSQSDEENFEQEIKDSMDLMSTDEDKASGNREEMEAMPLLPDVLVQKEFGGQADTVEKNEGLHPSSEALGCEKSYVVGTVSGCAFSEPADRVECQFSIQQDGHKLLCQEANIMDKYESVKPVDFCHAVLTDSNVSKNYATDGHEDQKREETFNHVSPLICGTGVNEKACVLDCLELNSATRETQIQDAAISRSLLMVQGEAVLESCTESFRMKDCSPFVSAESEGRENTFADEVVFKTSVIEAAAEVVPVEESKSKEILSSAECLLVSPDETVRLNSSDFEIVNSCDAAVAKQSKHEETADFVGLSQQSSMGCTGRTHADGSPVESEIVGPKSDALESEKSSRCSGLDQMEEINGELLGFGISSAKKDRKTGFYSSTPTNLVENSRCNSVIDGSKGKENTPVVKMDHSYKHNPDKSAIIRSSRRPLQNLPK